MAKLFELISSASPNFSSSIPIFPDILSKVEGPPCAVATFEGGRDVRGETDADGARFTEVLDVLKGSMEDRMFYRTRRRRSGLSFPGDFIAGVLRRDSDI